MQAAAVVIPIFPFYSILRRRLRASTILFAVCTVGVLNLCTQSAAQTPASGTPAQTQPQKPAPVTTTVVVHGEVNDNYLPEAVTAGTIDGAPLREVPLSATAVTRGVMNDQMSRVLSDVVRNDASIGEDYAPVGYYGDFEIRGFPLDLATGLEINSMTIAGEQDVPLENKERVEFLKGIAGVESGVASAGGLINYVTKRPAAIKALDLGTDHRGSVYTAVDLGHLFGSRQQVGARVNLAGEKIQSYVNGADGWRAVGAGSADWKISPKAILKGDFEYQHKRERSVSGYQLLGGDTVPDMNRIYPSTMLGQQSWEKPNIFDTFNTGTRFDYDLAPSWHAFAAGSFSHSLIDDNVVYAYGTSYDPETGEVNCPGAPDAPYYFFCPDGTYGIYDYRDPGELRIDAEAEAMVIGHVHTGAVTQDLVAGGEIFLRSVQQPGAPPAGAPDTVQDGAVYTYVGSENIYQPIVPVPIEDPLQSAGPRTLWEDNHQAAAIVQERIHLPERIQLIAGGRYDSLRDHNYTASQPTDKSLWLPTYAVTYSPIDNLTLYANYAVLLSLGPQAPFWTDNSSQFLAPFFTRQVEIGAKYEPDQRILLTTAFYRMRAPFFYPKALENPDSICAYNYALDTDFAPGDLCFESEGHETHDGIELNAQGRATGWLKLMASMAAMSAISNDTGTPSFDDKQVINAPRVRTALFAELAMPRMHGFYLSPGWSYTDRKEATRDDAVSVGGYNIFNLGARYTPGGEQGRLTLRIYADNITDKRYWKDTGASLGDTFIHLGAPTTVRLAAHYTF